MQSTMTSLTLQRGEQTCSSTTDGGMGLLMRHMHACICSHSEHGPVLCAWKKKACCSLSRPDGPEQARTGSRGSGTGLPSRRLIVRARTISRDTPPGGLAMYSRPEGLSLNSSTYTRKGFGAACCSHSDTAFQTWSAREVVSNKCLIK